MASGIVISRSSVPVVRSRSIEIEVTRNIVMNGNIPSIGAPRRSNSASPSSCCSRNSSTLGTTISSAMVRGSWRICASTRAVVANVMRALTAPPRPARRNAASISCSPVRSRSSAGVVSATRPPSRISSSRSQRAASSITWLETSNVAPSSARRWNRVQRSRRSTGSSPTVGSSSTSRSGSPSSAAASDTRERWPPDSVPVSWSPASARSTAASALPIWPGGTPSTDAK